MSLSHAVLRLDHHHADVIQLDAETSQLQHLKDSPHETRQHHSGVRTQHEFFGTVCDALAPIPMVLVAGSRHVQVDFRHYVETHRAHLLPQIAGWEVIDALTDKELVALARTFFRGHDQMIGVHTLT